LKQPEHTKNVLHPRGEQASNDFTSLPQVHLFTGTFRLKKHICLAVKADGRLADKQVKNSSTKF
jgi:hypothetical protein